MSEPVFLHEKKTWHDANGDALRDRESYVVLTPEVSVEAWRTKAYDPDDPNVSHNARMLNPTGYYGGVEVHLPEPLYDGHQPLDRPCQYVKGSVCYPDGSSLAFDHIQYAFDDPKYMHSYLLGRLEDYR